MDLKFPDVTNGNDVKLLFFTGSNCGVCVALKPKIDELIRNKFPDVKLQYINTAENMELAAQHLVFTVPTVLILLNSREINRFSRAFGVGQVDEVLGRLFSSF